MINLISGNKKKVRPLQRSGLTGSDPQGDVALSQDCRQGDVRAVQRGCHPPKGDTRGAVAPARALLGSSHPPLLPAAPSVWEGGVKKGGNCWDCCKLQFIRALLPHQVTETIRRSQQKGSGEIHLDRHPASTSQPRWELWERGIPSRQCPPADKYLNSAFPCSQTLPSPHAL